MGHVYIYTGTGAGKTSSALGLALRSIGHGHKVVIIQFLKWWKKTGEYKIKKKLGPQYEIYQFGRRGWKGFENLDERDKRLCKKAIEFAKKIAEEKKPHLLILDEVNLAIHCKLIRVEDVLELIERLPKKTNVILTGRFAKKRLIERADFVSMILPVKSPKEAVTTEGIQY